MPMKPHRANLGPAGVLVALCVTLGAFRADAVGPESPLAVVDAIYKQELKGSDITWNERGGRHTYVSASLAGLWDRADAHRPKDDDVGPIDFDLAADTNGLTLVGFEPAIERQDGRTATVGVKLRYQKPYVRPDPAFVTYDLIRDGVGWKIDEIHTARWSLRALLRFYLKPS